MSMTNAQILNLFKDCDFSLGISYDNFEDELIECLPDDFIFTYNYGVSKAVIIPKGENFVIKIPFRGQGFDCENEFENANGDYLRCWDYCFTELLYYHSAKKNHVAEILAKPRFIGFVNNYPIYTQQRVQTFYNRYGDCASCKYDKESKQAKKMIETINSSCENNDMVPFNMKWMMDILAYYGEKKFNNIMAFIRDIGDLHDENIGYIDDRPVILDYADWNDEF